MRQIELSGTGVRTSVLGFGTAVFGARLGSRARRRLLDTAFDAGVTHLDTAPLYGDGTAEDSVGAFLAGRRDRLTVAAKIGLLAPPGGAARRFARAAARRAGANVAEARRLTGAEGRASLESTLRRLRTDHVDLLLLHECRHDDPALDELRALAESAVAAGRARATGIATDVDSTRALLAAGSPFPAVVQVADSVIDGGDATGLALGRGLVVHSVLARDLARVHAHVSASEARSRAWRDASGVDDTPAALAPLLLRATVDSNPGAVVLFASREPEHVRANAAIEAVEQRAVDELRRVLVELRK